MRMRRIIAGLGAVVVAVGLTACSGSSGSKPGGGASALSGKVTGTITVLTNRTDLVDSVFRKVYAPEFEKLYPGTTVKFQAITNYEGDVTTRLSSGNAGDVALIPGGVATNELSQFFEPLGTSAALSKTYRFIAGKSLNGTAYGIPTFGNTVGLVYNKTLWKDAGLTDFATTPAQFVADMKQLKAKTGAVPYYTNYKDSWPLGSWDGNQSMFGDADAHNQLLSNKAPWASQTDYTAVSDSLLFDLVHDGLTEKDPTTTNWENSKTLLATGKVASMYLGSWAIPQMQDAAKKAGKSADEIGFMPFPFQTDGKFTAFIGPDYFNGVTKSSKNKATAAAWIKWFTLKSDFAARAGAIGSSVTSKNPTDLQAFAAAGVTYLEQTPPAKGKEDLFSKLKKASQIDIDTGAYRQKLIDVARGAASGTKSSYFASLDQQWSQAVSSAG